MALQANALATVADLISDNPRIATAAQAERFINAASDMIEGVCGRKFQRVAGQVESVAGYGTTRLILARTPIESIASIVYNGATVDADGYEIEDRDAGLIYASSGWRWTAQVLDGAAPVQVPGSERPLFVVTFTGGYVLPNDAIPDPGTYPDARTVPASLVEACLQVATSLYKTKGRDTQIQAESLGGASVQYAGGVSGRTPFGQGVMKMLGDFMRGA